MTDPAAARIVLTTRPVVPPPHEAGEDPLVFAGVVLGPADGDRLWLHLNVLGVRIPQQYRTSEVDDATPDLLDRHRLCRTCRGYGLPEPALSIAEDGHPPCTDCGGSGSTRVRVDIHHHPGGGVTGTISPQPGT